ncbi:MAG: type II secretion system F family protein [Candidatus Eiseniibacteriota bacterium]|jgi:tight adherence protein C
MIGIMGIGLLALGFLMALVASLQLLSTRRQQLERRLYELGSGGETAMALGGPEHRAVASPFSRLLTFAATLAPGSWRGQGLRDQLAGGGFYSSDAVQLFIGAKVLLAGLLGTGAYALLVVTHQAQSTQVLCGLVAALAGFQLPAVWLRLRTARRRQQIRIALPDALDLLVVCVEAGLGLNAAIVRVGNELRWNCPPLSQELRLLNQEIRAGNSRTVALRNFAARVPIADIRSLVAMFIQCDRLGTSIGRSLRVHADLLRTKRRQRAEENARKATVKLIFPLVFFVFPELLVVILGPAGLELFTTLSKMVNQ